MPKEWSHFLIFLGEIRKALAQGGNEIERAYNRPPSITREEFHELRKMSDEDLGHGKDARWKELCDKFIDWKDTPFYETNEGEWCLNIALDVTLEYNDENDTVTLEWSMEWEACNIVPMLMRIAILFPDDTRVVHSHLLVTKSMVVGHNHDSLSKKVDFEESLFAVEDYLRTCILHIASLYDATAYWTPGTKMKKRVFFPLEKVPPT